MNENLIPNIRAYASQRQLLDVSPGNIAFLL
jgi:hypothetical protein